MQQTGADIVKIATTANKTDDILNISSLYRKEAKGSMPLIAFCMGEIGKISRLLSLSLGSYLVFTSSGPGKSTAPGQISLHDFKAMVALLQK
jgi:3-dehydroquinate dehydratase type I